MKGTEKQIAWAEDIKRVVLTTIDNMLDATANDPRANNDKGRAVRAKFERARNAVAACESAHDLIEVYQHIDTSANEASLMRAVGMTVNNKFGRDFTDAQRALIGE